MMKIYMNIWNYINSYLLAIKKYFSNRLNILLLLWLGWVILPLFSSGFISDDAYTSQLRGTLIHSNINLFDKIFAEITNWLSLGRFNPFHWILWFTYFYLFPSLLLFKITAFLIIYLNLFYFRKILEHITQSKPFSYCIIFLVPILFQFRYWHDPILAFPSIPLACLYLFLSINFLIKYLEIKKKSYFLLFNFVFVLSLLSYEVAYISPVFYFMIAYLNNKSFKKSLVLIFLPLTFIVSHVLFKLNFLSPLNLYPSTELHLDLVSLLYALFLQITSTIPFSWRFSAGFDNFPILNIATIDLLVPLILSWILSRFINLRITFCSSIDKYRLNFLALFSFLLIFIPSLVVAISGHQTDIINAGFGYGYLLVFFQYFGLSSLFFILIGKFERSFLKTMLLFLIIVSTISVTRIENYHVVNESNKIYKYPRDLLGKSIESGILEGVTNDDLILRDERYPSDHFWFYSMEMQSKLNICSVNVDSSKVSLSQKEIDNLNKKFNVKWYLETKFPYCLYYKEWDKIYGLSYYFLKDKKSGQVIFAPLEIVNKNQRNKRFKFKEYKIYDSTNNSINKFSGDIYYDFNKARALGGTRSSSQYEIGSLILDKVSLSFVNFYNEEGDATNFLRWSSGKSKIILHNDTESLQNIILDFSIIRPSNDNLQIKIRYKDSTIDETLRVSKDFILKLPIEPGETTVLITSKSSSLDNGDPREIVFGISNYTLLLDK